MIVGGHERLEIGKVYEKTVTDADGNAHQNTRFVPIREVTIEEYYAYAATHGNIETHLEPKYAYEISMD